MEWIYTQTKASGQGSLHLALEAGNEKERTICTFFTTTKQLVQAYLIVSLDVSELRYSGVDHENQLKSLKFTCSEFIIIYAH
jgi:hypothetical protein